MSLVAAKIRFVTLFGGRAAVRRVELDAEILVRAAGIVAGRQDDPAIGAPLADQVRGGRRRQKRILPNDHPRRARRRRHPQDHLRRAVVEIAPVAAQNESLALGAADPVPDRLDEIFEVMRAHEGPGLLAQAGGAGLLSVDGIGLDCQVFHGMFLSLSLRVPAPEPQRNSRQR